MSFGINYLLILILLTTSSHSWIKLESEKNIDLGIASPYQNFSSYSQEIPDSDETIEMIPISGGEFNMGPFENNKTQKVILDPFWIGKFEISWNQYELFVKDNIQTLDLSNSALKTDPAGDADVFSIPTPPYVDMSFGMGKDGYPAISMTHYAAVMFTKWLYVKTGVFYRLPTEAEWEFTCKANHKDFKSLLTNGLLSQYAWFKENSNRKYHQIGEKKASDDGVHDLLGNVSEWTLDQYHADYSEMFSEVVAENPFIKPETLYPRTVRGGSWVDDVDDLACTRRIASNERWQRRDPQLPKSLWWLTDAPFVGFRIVRPKTPPGDQEIQHYWIEAMEAF